MAKAGLAEVCRAEGDLADAVRRLTADSHRLAAIAQTARGHTGRYTLADGLKALSAATSRCDRSQAGQVAAWQTHRWRRLR
jgi:hypothetical protein